MSETTTEPSFTGTPDQWWDQAEPLAEVDAAVRRLGDWYISPAGSAAEPNSSYRVSTPTFASNEPRRAALSRAIAFGYVRADDISPKVRRLIQAKVVTPEWLSAELVIADREIGSEQRVAWRKTSYRWQLLDDARIAITEHAMAQLNPQTAVIMVASRWAAPVDE